MNGCEWTRRGALAGAGAAVLAGAAQGQAPAPSGPPADQAFDAAAAAWLDEAAQLSPSFATGLGDHRFDSQLDDASRAGRARRKALRDKTSRALAAVASFQLTRERQVDLALLRNQLELEAFQDETSETWAWDPLTYNAIAGGSLYGLMARGFAPLPERLAAATARMELLGDFLAQSRAALDQSRVPRVHAETLARQNAGITGLIDGMILAQAPALRGQDRLRLQLAAEAAKTALATHQRWVEDQLIPNARGDFRLGPAHYARKLALALNAPLTSFELTANAAAALASVRAEMYEIAARWAQGQSGAPPAPARPTEREQQALIAFALAAAAADIPDRATLVEEARATLDQATAFVRAKDLITLPDAPVRVIVMPEFQQGVAVAYCDSPGPLDRGLETFYAVSPIPAAWTDAQAISFLREYNRRSLHELTVHEAMPGHYVQIWHANRHPSTLRAVLASGTFVEGWACYAQDMMGEEGYFGEDPLRQLVNRKWALRVIVNALLDVGVHAGGMTEEAALRLMTETGFQEEREAAGKWVRAQVSSAQLPTYFVGWRDHFALRAEARRRWGSDFALKRYHDTVLSFGAPPARHVRSLMFGEPIG